MNTDESVFKLLNICVYLCSSVDVVLNLCVDLRGGVQRQADKYSLFGQGIVMGLPTVFGEDPKK